MAKAKTNRTRRSTNRRGGLQAADLNYSVPSANIRASVGGDKSDANLHNVCALTDPFCEHARGSKIPSDDSAASVPYTQVWTYALASDSNGRVGAQVRATPTADAIYGGNVMTASGISSWTTSVAPPDNAVVTAGATSYRVVSFGVRVYSLLAPTNQSGYLKVITATDVLSASTALDTTGGLFEHVETYPVADIDLHWVGAPVGVDWKEYIGLTTRPPMETFVMFGEGLPVSTTCFNIEVFTHYELQPTISTLAAALSTPGRRLNQSVLTAASAVHAAKKKSISGPTRSFSSMIVGLAGRALRGVVTQLLPGMGRLALEAYAPRRAALTDRILEVD